MISADRDQHEQRGVGEGGVEAAAGRAVVRSSCCSPVAADADVDDALDAEIARVGYDLPPRSIPSFGGRAGEDAAATSASCPRRSAARFICSIADLYTVQMPAAPPRMKNSDQHRAALVPNQRSPEASRSRPRPPDPPPIRHRELNAHPPAERGPPSRGPSSPSFLAHLLLQAAQAGVEIALGRRGISLGHWPGAHAVADSATPVATGAQHRGGRT